MPQLLHVVIEGQMGRSRTHASKTTALKPLVLRDLGWEKSRSEQKIGCYPDKMFELCARSTAERKDQ